MRAINYKTIFGNLILMIVLTACVQNDDFRLPTLVIEEPNLNDSTLITLDSAFDAWQQEFTKAVNDAGLDFESNFDTQAIEALRLQTKLTFENDDRNKSQYLVGYVVSSDKAGNFFEKLILQDKPENPTRGVRLLVDVNSLYTRYEFGRKIYVKLDGLSIGIENGVASLGILSGSTVGQIPSFSQEEFIKRSAELATIIPLVVTIEDFSDDIVNLFIKIDNVQFNRNDVLRVVPLSFAGEPSDQFDGERTLENCDSGATTIVSTSTFADFKSLKLPPQKGSFEGVLAKSFFGDAFNLILNDPTGVAFDIQERCDPQEIACGLASTIGNINLFSDDFENQNTNNLISGNGWINYIEEGTKGWEAYSSTGTNASLGISAKVSSFGSDDISTISWLISPQIDLDAQDGETLRFKTSTSFADSSKLDVLFSKDWDGVQATISTATWGVFNAARIVQEDDYFGSWIASGDIDLSCETGAIYIAFRYKGNDVNDDFNGTYELDEISVNAN